MAYPLYHRPSDRMTTGTWALATGTARTGYPLTNLENSDPSSPFWANETTIRLVKDQLSALQVDHVYLFAHTFVNAASLAFQMHTANSWGTPDVSVPATIPTPYEDGFTYGVHFDIAAAYPTAANRTKRYLSIANTVANAVTCAIGEIWIVGSSRVLTKSIRWSFTQPRVRLTSGTLTKRGVRTVYDYGSIERSLIGNLPAGTQDFLDLRSLEADARGGARAFPFTLDAANTIPRHAEPLYVRIGKSLTAADQVFVNYSSVSVQLDELGQGELVGA